MPVTTILQEFLDAERPQFEMDFPEVYALMEKIGVHPDDKGIVQNPFGGKDFDKCGNIGRHCEAVAFVTKLLMRMSDGFLLLEMLVENKYVELYKMLSCMMLIKFGKSWVDVIHVFRGVQKNSVFI